MCHFRGTIPAAWDGMMPLLQNFALRGNQLRRACCKGLGTAAPFPTLFYWGSPAAALVSPKCKSVP